MYVFAQVVAHGSFSAAARALGHTKSSVSQAVTQLERDLDAKLLVRTTRQLQVTEIGARFHERCAEIARLAHLAIAEVEEFGERPTGALTITVPHALVNGIVAPVLARYCRDNPGIEPDLVVDDAHLDLIAHTIDVAISVGKRPDSSYRIRRVGSTNDVLCASPRYFARQTHIAHLTDIDTCKVVAARWQGRRFRRSFRGPDDTRVEVTLNADITSNSMPSVVSLLRNAMGVGVVPATLIADDLAEGRLIQLFPDHALAPVDIHAVHPFGANAPLKVKAFIRYLRQFLAR